MVIDVKGAHRLIPIAEQDWPLQACRLEEGGEIYVFTVGTFGIASAAYWWSRAGSAVSRLVQYIISNRAATHLLLTADDYLMITTGAGFRPATFTLLLVAALIHLPLSWPKIRGGPGGVGVGGILFNWRAEGGVHCASSVSYTHLRAHQTDS